MKHILTTANVHDLTPGYHGDGIDFDFKPRQERTGADLADWDDLFRSVRTRGLINPLVCYGDHVLIGMRRWECAHALGIKTCRVVKLLEPVRQWRLNDVRRLYDWLRTSGIYRETA
jgi:hypothetical protein